MLYPSELRGRAGRRPRSVIPYLEGSRACRPVENRPTAWVAIPANPEKRQGHETWRRAKQLDWIGAASVPDRGDFARRPLAQPAKAASL